MVTAIKPHEDGKGMVVRLYETDDIDTTCNLTILGKSITLQLAHSQVKTLIIGNNGEVTETDFVE